MITRPFAAAVLAPLLFLVGHVNAHHSGWVLDHSTTIERRGTVVEFRLKSPHSTLVIDTAVFQDGSGDSTIERWEIETPPVGPMLRTLGIRPDTFERGDAITVLGWPHRHSRFKFARAITVVAADGTEWAMSTTESPGTAASIGIERPAPLH
jgi:Family of unknown function (DUF6152)